ncbi:MAG: hypothetical protein WD512_17140 [Candidatus Paceibacterota bacterium]
MTSSRSPNPSNRLIDNANQIVANHLVENFLNEVDFYFDTVPNGKQHVIFTQKMISCVVNTSKNVTSEALLELFCSKFTDKTNILNDVQFKDNYGVPTLKFTLMDKQTFWMQDFSKNFFNL